MIAQNQALESEYASSPLMGRIRALDADVVHKIAAGEVVISPANALKELIENSLDSGATSVDVVVKDGGHKLLQITDNGCGIDEEDLPILCQRFTTSKLARFEELSSIATLGFRGEALASISHISHLTVKTKTEQSRLAIQACYEEGAMTSTKKVAGVMGTQISVEDLFYNNPMRQRALQGAGSRSAEYQKILDVVTKYAIQYDGTFTCRRFQDNQPVVVSGSDQRAKIKEIYGAQAHQQLISLQIEPKHVYGLQGVKGYITGLDYSSKRSIPFIFFINKRLVSCEPLARALRKLYQEQLPRGSAHPFVFMSILIDPNNVDVNIHPTKREVHFLHDTKLIDEICDHCRESLIESSNARDYRVQSYISATTLPHGADEQSCQLELLSDGQHRTVTSLAKAGGIKPRYEYNLVRTDPKQYKITSYTKSSSRAHSSSRPSSNASHGEELDSEAPIGAEHSRARNFDDDISSEHYSNLDQDPQMITPQDSYTSMDSHDEPRNALQESAIETSSPQPERAAQDETNGSSSDELGPDFRSVMLSQRQVHKQLRDVPLESVQRLLREVKLHASPNLLELFSEHTFIGLVDPQRGLAAIQFDVRLYLIEYHDIARELFYQLTLTQFANFGTIHLGDGLPLLGLLEIENCRAKRDLLNRTTSMAEMLEEYFQIILRERDGDWYLVQLPLLIPAYSPPLSRLPRFIADLVSKVSWDEEEQCLSGIIEALAAFHVPTSQVNKEKLEVIFETVKNRFVPSRALLSCVVEIASLPGLYKVFERC